MHLISAVAILVAVGSSNTPSDAQQAWDATHTMTLRPVTIVGDAPALTWVCGPVEANRLGGSQRTCSWR